MKYLFISLALISFTSISNALNISLYCELNTYTFLSLEIRDDAFEVKHAITTVKSKASEDFKTNELIEDEFTIKVYDDKNQNIYMFNKFTYYLKFQSVNEKTYKMLKESNLTLRIVGNDSYRGDLDYKCINK